MLNEQSGRRDSYSTNFSTPHTYCIITCLNICLWPHRALWPNHKVCKPSHSKTNRPNGNIQEVTLSLIQSRRLVSSFTLPGSTAWINRSKFHFLQSKSEALKNILGRKRILTFFLSAFACEIDDCQIYVRYMNIYWCPATRLFSVHFVFTKLTLKTSLVSCQVVRMFVVNIF